MPCGDKTKRCGVSVPVDLRVVDKSLGLHKELSIALMGDLMAWESYNCPIIAFHLSTSFWMVYSRSHVFCIKTGSQSANKFDGKLWPFLVRRHDNIPYRTPHASKNILTTADAVILGVGMARVSCEYLFVIVTKSLLPLPSWAADSRYIATNSSCLVAGKRCRWRLCLNVVMVLKQLW